MVSILSVLFIHLNSIINRLLCLLLSKLGHLKFVDVGLILFIMMMHEQQPALALENVARLLGRFGQLATSFLASCDLFAIVCCVLRICFCSFNFISTNPTPQRNKPRLRACYTQIRITGVCVTV